MGMVRFTFSSALVCAFAFSTIGISTSAIAMGGSRKSGIRHARFPIASPDTETFKTILKPNSRMFCRKFDTRDDQNDVQNPIPEISWSYCITLNFRTRLVRQANNSSDLLYYLHGASWSETSWDEMGMNFFRDVERPPIVVAISFFKEKTATGLQSNLASSSPLTKVFESLYGKGSTQNFFLLTERNELSSKSGLFEVFTDKIMPYIESLPIVRFSPGNGKRMLMGSSMGGANAASLLLTRPDLWDRVVINAAAIFKVFPWDPDFGDYYKSLYGEDAKVEDMFLPENLYGEYFTDSYPPQVSEQSRMLEVYDKTLNPFLKVRNLGENPHLGGHFPDTLFYVTEGDELRDANRALYEDLDAKISNLGLGSSIRYQESGGMHVISLMTKPKVAQKVSRFLTR